MFAELPDSTSRGATARLRFSMRALTLLGAAFALALGLGALAPQQANAVAVGPFDVDGPAGSYAWDGSTLSVASNGVTVVGMADPASGASGDVSVADGVSHLDLGSDVRISTLSMAGTTGLRMSGDGNEVRTWRMATSAGLSGKGSVTLGEANMSIEVLPSSTVVLEGGIPAASIWAGATLVLDPAASIDSITHFGGTLDLSRIPIGSPVSLTGYSVGGQGTTNTIVAPFGATDLSELMAVEHLFVNGGDTGIVENGERVGTLKDDGSFFITATRTVSFTGYEGVPLATEEVTLFGAAAAPEVPVPDGYEFTGWDRAFDYVTENMTVAARFEALPGPEPGWGPGDGGAPYVDRALGAGRMSVYSHALRPPAKAGVLAKTEDAAAPPAAIAAIAAAVAATALAACGAFAARSRT